MDESPEDEDKGAWSGIMGEWGREEGKERTKQSYYVSTRIWPELTLLIQKICSQLLLFRAGYPNLFDLDILKFCSRAGASELKASFG